MKEQVRRILLNQYIGAIAIGYLVGRGIEALIGAFMPGINGLVVQVSTGGSPGQAYWSGTVRSALISNTLLAALYFGTSFLVASWLYAEPPKASDPLPSAATE